MILYMYIAPGQGHTIPCDKLLMSTESFHHFVHLLQGYKKKSDFKHIFNDFIYVYSPEAKADNPLRIHFWCQQKALITLPVCCRFKNNCFEVQFYIHFFMFHHMYIAPGRGKQSIGDKILMTTEMPFLFAYMLQVSNDLIKI